jgi:hypothetical protein
MKRLRPASVVAIALASSLGSAACAQSTNVEEGVPVRDLGGPAGACDERGLRVVVLSSEGDFYGFVAATRTFTKISHVECAADVPLDDVYAGAIARDGTAWITYFGRLPDKILPRLFFPVRIEDGTCGAPVPISPGAPATWYAAGPVPGTIVGATRKRFEDPLAVVTYQPRSGNETSTVPIAPYRGSANTNGVALSVRPDGTLEAFVNALGHPDVVPFFATVDTTTGSLARVPGSYPIIETPTLRTPLAELPVSMVHWGNTRLLFAADPATASPGRTGSRSMVVSAKVGQESSEAIARELPFLVVASGLVPCANGAPVR